MSDRGRDLRRQLDRNATRGRAGRHLSNEAHEDHKLVSVRFLLGVHVMFPKRILVRDRVRRPPKTGWSWIDRRFVREQSDRLSRDAILLYFFLCAVADQYGLSYYGDLALTARLRMTTAALEQARAELLMRDLIAHERPLIQVLSLPASSQRLQAPSGQGLFQLGDILREAAGFPVSDSPRKESP